MKKLLRALLGLLIAITVYGCSDKETTYRIGVSQCSYDDWRVKLNDEISRQQLIYDDIDVKILCAYDDPQRQVEDIRSLIEEDVDVIIASPIKADNLDEILTVARNKGIKVITFDRATATKCSDVFVGADNEMLGRAAANFLISQTDGSTRLLEIQGDLKSSPAIGRRDGFRHIIDSVPAARLLGAAEGFWTENEAERVTDSLLTLYPETNAIYAHNDRMAIGARKATLRHHRPDIKIAGADGVPQLGIKAVADGVIDATFIYPTAGAELIDFGRRAAMGEPLADEIIISSALPVDKSNAEILLQLAQSIEDEKGKISFLQEQVSTFSNLHAQQKTLIIAILSIMVLLAIICFLILRAFWQRKKNQTLLAEQNEKLISQRDQLESQRDQLSSQRDQLTAQRDKLSELNTRLQEATQSKLMFYTNVSHDLRTPLTLIAEPINQIKDDNNLTPHQHSMLRLADKNTRILLRLINQILDFRKYENGKLILNLAETDIRRHITDWTEAFRELARKRRIHLHLNITPALPASVAVDEEKMERVFFNLMSNAIKYTRSNGNISVDVTVSDNNESLVISVTDDGKGISEENLPKIFERFYQAEKTGPRGTGIGLALTKAFVNLHDGDITVRSEIDKGSVFTITIPIRHINIEEGADAPGIPSSEDLITTGIESGDVVAELAEIDVPEPEEGDTTGVDQDQRPIILVIDDTADLRTLLRETLSDEYVILEAPDGEQGIRLASKYIPDLIICDVMMPGIGGYECVKRLKGETATSHIPVIMLTACSMDEQQAKGFDSGADGYLPKPFNTDVLRSQIRSLIANRRLIIAGRGSEAVSGFPLNEPKAERPSRGILTPEGIENEFYQRFIKIIDEEIGNADISVEEIGNRLGLSRVQFYRKIKALTNSSPNEIMRERRLKLAYKLLISNDCTVAEVAYRVGFNSPGYFAKCFKEYHGELPLDLQKRTSKNNR